MSGHPNALKEINIYDRVANHRYSDLGVWSTSQPSQLLRYLIHNLNSSSSLPLPHLHLSKPHSHHYSSTTIKQTNIIIMPPRARPTRSTASGRAPTAKSLSSSARQSSLTFNNNKNNNRVTKPAVAPSTKDKKAEGKAAKLLLQQSEDQPSPRVSAEEIRPDNDEIEEGGKREEVNTAQIPLRIQLPQQAQQTKQKIPSSGPEATAQKITKSQIKKYWTTKESERKTPRGRPTFPIPLSPIQSILSPLTTILTRI